MHVLQQPITCFTLSLLSQPDACPWCMPSPGTGPSAYAHGCQDSSQWPACILDLIQQERSWLSANVYLQGLSHQEHAKHSNLYLLCGQTCFAVCQRAGWGL